MDHSILRACLVFYDCIRSIIKKRGTFFTRLRLTLTPPLPGGWDEEEIYCQFLFYRDVIFSDER
jgi:hypothetical protein